MVKHSNPSSAKASQTASTSLLEVIVDSIQDIKGKNIIKIDLRDIDDAPTDFFIICEGESTTQIKSIASSITRRVREELQLSPSRKEGETDARWQLIDYFDTVVHVFYPETRQYYDLEDLWSDGTFTHYDDVE